MSDTNYIGGIVKILEIPKQRSINNDIVVTKFRAQLPQARNTRIVHLTFWGNLAQDVANYYKVNDYIIVEGYLSLRDKKAKERSNIVNRIPKKIEVTVLKIYPFLLSYDRSINKI